MNKISFHAKLLVSALIANAALVFFNISKLQRSLMRLSDQSYQTVLIDDLTTTTPAFLSSFSSSLSNPIRETTLSSSSSSQRQIPSPPIGSLGPMNTPRHHLRYYDSLYYTALQFGADAKSVIEVGCAADPFIKHLHWIDGRRTCVAPYFVKYEGEKNRDSNTKLKHVDAENEIEKVSADFMDYELPPNGNTKFDLLLCSQVLEHVPDPSKFMKKLIKTAKTSIISVPYKWLPCGKTCSHVTDNISENMIAQWALPHKPIYWSVVNENIKGRNRGRIILVFQPKEKIPPPKQKTTFSPPTTPKKTIINTTPSARLPSSKQPINTSSNTDTELAQSSQKQTKNALTQKQISSILRSMDFEKIAKEASG